MLRIKPRDNAVSSHVLSTVEAHLLSFRDEDECSRPLEILPGFNGKKTMDCANNNSW